MISEGTINTIENNVLKKNVKIVKNIKTLFLICDFLKHKILKMKMIIVL